MMTTFEQSTKKQVKQLARYKSETISTTASTALSDARAEIESLQEEMSEWRDNMEEYFSETDKFQRVSDAADALEELLNGIPEDVPDAISELNVSFSNYKAGRRGIPRWARLSNAMSAIEAVRETVEEAINDLQSFVDECEADGSDIDFPSMFG